MIEVTVHHDIHINNDDLQLVASLINHNPQLDRIESMLRTIMATEQQVVDALNKIDAATTKIGTNVQTVADTLQTVSNEVDALEAALKAAGVSDALVAQAGALSDKVQQASDALDAQVPVLQGIAAKGVMNPVPTPVPAPPNG